jgi:uncharacterized protein (TIGR04168 family)
VRLGVIGDVHLEFDERDVEILDACEYDALLFVGDLATYSHRAGLEVARAIGRLRTRAYVIPGNHDAANVFQMAAEVLEADRILPLLNLGQRAREKELAGALGNALVVGYSRHLIEAHDRTIELIAARPHSAGGPHMAFRPYLEEAFGIDGMESSAARLCELVEESEGHDVVFLAHNGPTGLGERKDDIWGCDFRREGGDFGDPDLRRALDHARALGKRVRAIIAGHMHHAIKGGGQRRWRAEEDGVLFLNAARVPRVFTRNKKVLRHHVEVVIDDERVRVREVLAPS